MSVAYSLGNLIGELLTVNLFGVKIVAGMVEWGLLLGIVSFISAVVLMGIGRHAMSTWPVSFVRAVIRAPIVEEIIFRLVLISVFTFVFDSVIIAIVLSAGLFAFAHLLYGGLRFLDCFITGLIWGWAFLNLGLGVTIIAYATHNFLCSTLRW